jgi:hypothetical protein
MIPMDREVDELAEVYSPQQLQQKYKVTQELMYLLALQKVQSDMKAAQNQLAMSQQQQPGTIKDQMEGQVFQEKLRQVSGTIAQQEAQKRQQQPQLQQRMMASGGIVGFAEAGEVESEGDTVSYADLAAEFGTDALEWVKNNPAEAALLGISFIPVGGAMLGGAFRLGKKAYDVLKANPTAQRLASKAKDLAVQSVTKPAMKQKTLTRGNTDQPLGEAAKSLGLSDKATQTVSAAGRKYSPGKGFAISSGIAGASSALGDDEETEEAVEETEETTQAGAGTGAGTGGIGTIPFPGQNIAGGSAYGSSSPSPSMTPPAAGAGTATGTGGIASQIRDLDDTKSAVEVFDETSPGLRQGLIERAKQTAEGIEKAAMGAGDRAAEVAGRDKKAEQFERMRREQEELYDELQDPDKQQAQMRRNIFAAFGRGGNSFGQLMSNALTAIGKTEAGQDQLKQIALDKKQGITTKAIEIDLKAAGQINAAIDNAQSIYAADRRQAETILAGLSSDEFKGIQQSVRNNFDLNNARVTAALDEMKILAQREATQSAREIKSLSVAQAELADINDLKTKVHEAVMANPIGRMAELKAKKAAGELSDTEAAEYNKLADEMYLQITSFFEQQGLNDRAEELARRIDLFTSRTEEQGDVSRALNKYGI